MLKSTETTANMMWCGYNLASH